MSKHLEDLVPRRTDGERSTLPVREQPPRNTESEEETKRRVQEMLLLNPELAEYLKQKERVIFGLPEKSEGEND